MRKIILSSVLALSIISSPVMADDVKVKDVKFCYHPVPLTIGIVVGALTGGFGGLVVGALFGEGTARLVENGSLKCEVQK